ncbi:MAG TPA: DNA ligase D, partial [Rhizobacter sp.]|nr:DNA ligase D [Rhizobacter sp.]
GSPDFNALQNSFDKSKTSGIVYFLFDVPYFEGYDLRQAPLSARRDLLRQLLAAPPGKRVRFSNDFEADAASVLDSACKLHLEGVIAKRRDAVYESRRTETWLKLKCQRRQEFVIGGFTVRQGGAALEVGSLLLGVHDSAGTLRFCGSVGTGWNSKSATQLGARLAKIETPDGPFVNPDATRSGRWRRRSDGDERWVRPQLVAEVSFAEWTPDAQIRHAVFVGLRSDKPPSAITREQAVSPFGAAAPAAPKKAPVGGADSSVKVSNPQRVVDPSSGITKLDLARYYQSVAGWILPHLKGRPCSLVRAPSGISGELFFQKHAEKLHIPDVKDLDPALWPDHEALLEVATPKALAGASQMNVVEFHTWNAMARQIDQPDRMVFDVDPGDKVPWSRVQEAAVLTRALLTELGLRAWLKTSGGKGLHLVVPIAPRCDWDSVKGFSQAVVQHLAAHIPDRFVTKSGPSNRVGKIFVDYLRNGHGATTAAAFSARARPGLGVSMPVSWEQLDTLKSGAQWSVAGAREYLSFQTDDPWKDYWTCKQTITQAMQTLGYQPPAGSASR